LGNLLLVVGYLLVELLQLGMALPLGEEIVLVEEEHPGAESGQRQHIAVEKQLPEQTEGGHTNTNMRSLNASRAAGIVHIYTKKEQPDRPVALADQEQLLLIPYLPNLRFLPG
jgi:hypothetical protein